MRFVTRQFITFIIIILTSTSAAASTRAVEINSSNSNQAFFLTAIDFNYNPHLDSLELYRIYEPYLGTRIPVSRLQDICEAITNAYRKKGLFAASCVLPRQTIKNGVVDMYLFEGIVDRVQLVGDTSKYNAQLHSYISMIPLGHPLETKQFSQVKKLIDALPGITANVYIRPTGDAQKIDLVFAIQKRSYSAEAYINNRGSKVVGPVQVGVSLTGNSMLGMGETIKVDLLNTTQTAELRYFDLISAWPVASIDGSLLFGTSYVRSHPGDLLASLNIDTKISAYDAGWLHALASSGHRKMSVAGLLEYFKLDSTSNGARYEYNKLYKLKLVFNSQAQYANAFSKLKLSFVHGLPGLNTTISAASGFQSNGKEKFDAFRFSLYHETALTNNLVLALRSRGQYGTNNMPISEYISFGGEDMGSAYDPAEFFGNHGLGGSARLVRGLAQSWISAGTTQLFVQGGVVKVWDEDAELVVSGASLATGFILRTNSLYFDVQVAKPLTRPVLIEGNKNARLFADLRYSF